MKPRIDPETFPEGHPFRDALPSKLDPKKLEGALEVLRSLGLWLRRSFPLQPGRGVQSIDTVLAVVPELLEVVTELEESAEYWSEYDVPIGIVERIKAALAKARGEGENNG